MRRAAAGLLGIVAPLAWSSAQTTETESAPDSVRIPILVYHSVAPHHPGQTPVQRQLDVDTTVFEMQMRYLVDHGYRVISFARMVDALMGRASVPSRAVVITFDDGWANQYRHAFPVLRELGLTATFFIYSRPIGRDSLWMNWDQVRELVEAGMTIGSHSRTHPQLTNPSAALESEVAGSREDLKEKLGVTPRLFAYPYGDWDAAAAAAVQSAGYEAARAYPGGVWNSVANLFSLRSILVTDDMEAFQRALGP